MKVKGHVYHHILSIFPVISLILKNIYDIYSFICYVEITQSSEISDLYFIPLFYSLCPRSHPKGLQISARR